MHSGTGGLPPKSLPETNLPKTKESDAWRGKFGSQYSARNLFDQSGLDKLYQGKYGITRTALNHRFLADIPRSASILEVGCNLGNQLILLKQMGFENLTGIEIHKGIVEEAQSRVPWARVMEGSALQIAFGDASFDLVFTSGLLIHIAPQDLPVAMSELHRCARSWIWGLEYYAPEATEVPYRGHSGLLWKADYARFYTEHFPDLELVLEQRLSYVENDNVDTMFLLRRKTDEST
jgi:pseudaminic acid biosynthesis-associated methylase